MPSAVGATATGAGSEPAPGRRSGAGEVEIARLRGEIEGVDGELVALVERRCQLAVRLGAVKEDAGLPVADLAREAEVVRKGAARARASGLDEDVVRRVFWCLIDLSRRAQSEALR